MDETWIHNWIDEYKKVMDPLHNDLHLAAAGLHRHNQDFWRRVYIRSMFAMIEADIFQRKRLALAGHENSPIFEADDLTVLREVQYTVKKNGNTTTRPSYIELSSNYRLSFQLSARAMDSKFELNVGGQEWRDFLQCIEIRHRITHPKFPSCMDVSKDDVEMAQRVSSWCQQNKDQFVQEIETVD